MAPAAIQAQAVLQQQQVRSHVPVVAVEGGGFYFVYFVAPMSLRATFHTTPALRYAFV